MNSTLIKVLSATLILLMVLTACGPAENPNDSDAADTTEPTMTEDITTEVTTTEAVTTGSSPDAYRR